MIYCSIFFWRLKNMFNRGLVEDGACREKLVSGMSRG
jgi:hypothetical protein